MRTTAYQLHRQVGGVVVLDLGVVVVEREQGKQQQMSVADDTFDVGYQGRHGPTEFPPQDADMVEFLPVFFPTDAEHRFLYLVFPTDVEHTVYFLANK